MNKQQNTIETDTVMTRCELAKKLHIAPDTVTRWAKQGLPVLYIGKVKEVAKGARPRYLYSQVMKWLENQQSGIVW